MARHRRPHLKAKAVAAAMLEAKGLVHVCAQRLGCTPQTVYDWLKKSPQVAEAQRVATESMLDLAEGKLFMAINNSERWAIEFYLNTKGKSRGYVRRTELGGKDDKPMKFTLDFE